MKTYNELSVEEKNETERKIERALDSAHDYKGEGITEHDRKVIGDYLRDHLEILERGK